ncbi:CML15 [Symbiodinium sp. CCMP2592]|nr:CML15 [Symbiodinium sp. CCMP2592]
MEAIEEARLFAQGKVHDRIGSIRARTRRLRQLEEEGEHPPSMSKECDKVDESNLNQRRASSPVTMQGHCAAELQSECTRDRSAAGKCRPRPRRLSEPVLAFSFKTPRAPKPLLERDGSVSTTFHLTLPPPSATRPQLNFRLERRAAWKPSPPARRLSRDSSVSSARGSASKACAPVRQVSRRDTWGETGFAGLLGSESTEFGGLGTQMQESRPDDNPDGTASQCCAAQMPQGAKHQDSDRDGHERHAAKDEWQLDNDTREDVRRLSSAEHAKWRSSFNRYRHDGEIHLDDLSKALAHCGFRDRRPALIEEACKQVTRFATLDRDEFTSFVCLYESGLLNLYRAEFTKYEDAGHIVVDSFAPLLKELGLEPRQIVLDELVAEVCGCGQQLLSFPDVANMMELLREREGFRLTELERFRKVFQDFDSDDSGDMSAGELVSAMGWLGFPTANELVRDFYQTSDLNGNGVLSFSEFVIFLSHIQDRELVSIRNFLALKSRDGKISTLLELEAVLRCLGYFTSTAAITDALQQAGFCTKAEVAVLRLDWQGMRLDVDDICALLQCLRSREGFTDAQMDDLRQAFWQSEPKDEDRISTSGGLHKTLRWLGHCHSFERLQQLIYEVDPEGSQCLDFTTFVKLVRKCRDFERGASVAAFNAADTRNTGLLDEHAAALALQKLGFEEVKLPDNSRVGMDLNDFLLLVARLEKERLRCLRTYFNFSPTELGNLRMEFNRVSKDGSSELKRHELPRLVEVLFPVYAHSPEFRPILVRLLKEVKLDERQAVKYMDFLQLIRTIRDETEKHQCLVYAETIRRLEFSFREASEFLSVFLSASEEAQRKLSSEDLVTLFQQCFDISERECHQLHECFLLSAKTIPSKSRSAAPPQSCSFTVKRPEESQSFPPSMGFQGPKSSEETGMNFLDFLEIMRRVIEAGLGGALLHKGSFRARAAER